MRKPLLLLIIFTFFASALPAHSGPLYKDAENIPDNLDVVRLVKWIVPNKELELLRIVQIRPWNKNKFVVLVCSTDSSKNDSSDNANSFDYEKGECGNGNVDVYIAVISRNEQNYIFESRTDDPIPMDMNKIDGTWYELSLDLAPYKINESSFAIGLRRETSTAYAGGGAGSTVLWLFMQNKKHLHEILNLDVKSYETFAGEWNPDGTRNHEGYYHQSTLHVLKTKTNGVYDYLVKTINDGKKGSTKYSWSQKDNRYIPATP